ncbi:MAG: MerR family transcriptional regulator [Myxococcota bacterium]
MCPCWRQDGAWEAPSTACGGFEVYAIGQFSLMSRLSVRTLRRYHELGLLVPARIDEQSGYRYYGPAEVDRARVITALRNLDFSLKEIGEIIESCEGDDDMLDALARRGKAIDRQLSILKRMRGGVEAAITNVRQWSAPSGEAVQVKTIPSLLVVGFRTKGRWQDVGPLFGRLARQAGRHIAGPGMSMCHDDEYKDDDADMEVLFPVHREVAVSDGVTCRVLPEIRCASLVHRGRYEGLSRSYQTVVDWLNEASLPWMRPSRELYHRGPGMILRGNPDKYITEIQMSIPTS